MAEQNNFERGELITPASLELQKFQRDHSQISGAPITGDILRVSGTTAGPPNRQPANMTNEERALARINGTAMTAYKPDANRFNKITTYNATHHGRNFERYYANTAGFKKLGFSPFRDNEALYNKNTSLWDDAQRGIVTAAKLYGGAFAGAAKNWSNPFSLEPDAEEADEMERLMSIGSSSRGGFGGAAINFGVNMSYGMGVLGEVLAEEAAIAGIVALTGLETGGATAALGAARTGMNLKRLANAFSLGRAAKSFSNTFRAATKITEARQLWGVAKGLAKTADHLLPFSQSRSLLTASGKTAAKWNSLDNMAKTTKAFGSFYRDLREINAVTYESKLEGGSVQNDVITQMMSEFRKKNGRDPNDQEAKAMYGEGHKAGYLASQLNAVGIYISNKIVLNKALKGIPGLAQADDVARRTMKGTLIQNTNWAKKGVNPWEVARGVKKYGKASFYKQTFNPKNLAKGGLGYLSANLMEGTQEVYQEAVANGVTSYYMGAFNNPSRVGGAEFQAKMLGGLKSQMSGQGMETFLSGFLMAGPMTAAQSAFFGAVNLGRKGKLKIQDRQFKADPANAGKPSPFEQQLNAENDYDNKVVDALNDITKDPKKYFSAIEQNARTQVDLERLGEQAAADGDMHAAKNIKDESLTNHIITLLESGHFEIFQDQLKGLKDLETSELQEAFDEPGDAKKTVSQRIDTVLKRTEQIKATHEKYQAKVNPFSMREDPLSYMAFEQARNIAIRNDVTYQRTGERMTDILNQFNSDMPFSNANATDFTNLFVVGGMTEGGFDRIGLNSEVQLLDGQIQNLSDSIPEQKAQKDKLIQKRDDLKSLSGTIQAYASAYKVTQSAAQTEEEHAINMDTFIETEKVFKKAYADYVQNLAKGSGQTILNSAVDSSFDKLSDFWKLNVDREDVANAVNMMQNPDMYRVATERLRESMAIAFERRQESLKEALVDYKKKHLVNGFLNDLFEKYNAFVEPEEAEAYLNKDTIPETFYDADTLEEIEPGSAKYRGIMALIDQYDEIYFEETGERLIRTDELSNAERRTGYDVTTNKAVAQEFRPRDAKDKRSIKAIADEFGFNHIDTESSVDATEVLKAIAKSKHGYVPRAQKKLAQALLGFIKPGTQIRFKNGHRTNSTYDATNGIIVDANFSAEGFENANIPIEFSILNAVMQQVASESLSDAAFNDRITSVREQFEEALSDLDKKYFKYALTNNQQFIAEAMTNADLQAEMGKIGYEGELTEQTAEAKSVWESFMDSIYELLEKIFGVTRGKTLYQEAMNVITNKLSQPGVAGPSSVPSVLAENETEEEIDIEEEDDPELEQRLRAKFNEVVAAMSPADKVGMNFESWKQSDSMAVSIRNKYSAEKIKKATAAPSSPTVMTEAEQVRRLTSLGYQISEINNMKKGGQQDEIDSIIKNDTKKKIQIRTVDANGKTVYIEADYDQPIAARPNVAAAIKKALQTLDDANVDLNAAETMYNQRVQTGIDPTTGEPVYKKKDGTPDYERLSHVVKDKFEGTDKQSTDRGNIIDLLLRDFLNGDILDIRQFNSAYSKYQSKNNSAAFSQEMLNDLFDKFRSVQILLKSNGLTVISNLPGLFGKIGKKHTAGKIDLIAYDAAGKIYIIDLKTSTQDRRAQYKAETDLENAFGVKYSEIKEAIKGGKDRKKTISETLASTRISAEDKEKLKKVAEANPTVDAMFFYKDQDAKQQNGYRELLRQSTGLVADVLSIFPLVTTKAGKIFTKVEFQKEGKDHSMKVDIYDIHDKLGLVNEATYPENPIDRAAVTPTTTTEEVSPEEQPAEQVELTEKEDIEETIEIANNTIKSIKERIRTLQEFKNGTDSNAAVVQAEKDLEVYYAELKKIEAELADLKKELAALEDADKQPTTSASTDPRVADIERRRNVDLGGGVLKGEKLQALIKKALSKSNSKKGVIPLWSIIGVVDLTGIAQYEGIGSFKGAIDYNEVIKEIYNIYPENEADEIVERLNKEIKDSGRKYDVDKINAAYDAELAALGEQPTKKTTEQTIADLRAAEQVELRKAIPNIDDYPDTYGEKQGNMPGVLYGIYKVIYDRYDKLITDASGTKPKSKGRVKVKAFRTSNTFSSRVGFAQRGAGVYYGLDKPFVELFGESGEVSEVEVEYDPSKTLDALTPEGQAEFMKIKSSAVGNKTFTSIREMNEAVRRAMLTSGYDSLIGYITEDKPADGRELVLYNIVEANQGTDETDKEEMEEVFEEPTPKEEEPAREKTIYEKAFEKSPFQYRPTSSTLGYWDSVEGRIIYFSKKSGEKLLNNNRIRTAARKTFDPNNKKTHPNFKFWWNTLLDDRQRYAIIDGLQDPLWETAGNSDDMYSEEYRIMSRLRGMKFKPTKFNKAEFTDVSDKVWFSDKGANLDLFVMEDLIGDVNNGFPENTDQQDLQNTVIDIIIRYPNGITNYDLRQVLRRDSLQAQLEELMDSFAINYGVDLNSIAPLMDMYRDNLKAAKTIQEINDEEDRKNEGPSPSEEGNGQQSDSTEFLTKEQRRANQDEIDKLTQEYEATVAKRKTYYSNLAGKVGKPRYVTNVRTAEAQALASLKETYEQALEALGVIRSPESQLENISKMNLPESVLNLRESIAKADRVQLSTLEASLRPLSQLGIADAVLKQQNLTKDEVNDLIKNARARLKGTLAHAELANTIRLRKPLEERVVYYDTEKGTQAGVLISFDSDGVSVAPYDGKESLSDLQDESKWVTFTVGEIPYKLFYAKATAPVTATPDIEQQSDALMSEAEIKEAEDTEKLRKTIQDQKFKNQSMDDIENNLYDPLQDCPF